MASKSRLLSSVVNKSESLIGASLSQPNEVNLQALETAAKQYTDVTTLPASGYVGEQAYVASTNRLYIWTGAGWFNIALVNTDPTISSAGDANYTMSYGTPITVDVDASDPEGLGLSYSYYTSDSIGNIATITNDSSQFTITPSSDYSVEGSFGLVFRASDGPNIASSSTSTFTLTNQSPSLSGNSASYVLATDGSTPTVITLTSVDPEGQPITYTATGNSGFNAIATVSNDSSVFTIIPKSEDSAVSGTGTLTFTASDGIKSTSAPSSFTLLFSSTVENSRYTTLLATATGTSDNSNITDASTNNNSITVNGDAHAGTFSPYRTGGYSTYFDHTDRVYLTNDMSTALGTSGFSMEAWIYRTTTDSDENVIVNGPGNDYGWGLAIASGKIRARFHNTNLISGATTVSPNEWHHVMIARTASNELLIFLDGTLDARSTSSSINYNATSTTLTIGSYGDRTQLASYGFNGYIRDARVIVGYNTFPYGSYGTSVGTNYFTPPSEPLTAVSGTEALLCGLPYHGDLSSNNHSVTADGGAVTKPFSPYDDDEYSATDHGGSVYFDGTGDNITFPEVDFGTGDFFIEGWFNRSASNDGTVASGGFIENKNQAFMRFGKDTANSISMYFDNSFIYRGVSVGEEIAVGNWFHHVVTRSGTAIKAFINGRLIATGGSSKDVNISAVGFGHHNSGNVFNGYVSDFRVSTSIPTEYQTSSTTVGSSIFTPPTAPLSSSGAALHIKGTDASIIDKSQGFNLKLEGGVDNGWGLDKFITSQQAVEFNGSTQYLTVAGDSDFNFGSNDFTVEAWVYTDSSAEQVITSGRPNGASWLFLDKTTSDTIRILISTDGSSWAVNSTSTESMTLGRWNHISVSRDGSTINMYLNGRLIISTSISGSIHYNTSESIAIGSGQNDHSDRTWNGYISDFRIINGTAVAPPVNGPNEALTEVTNTKLLTCRPSGASITDLSTTGTTHTITSIWSTAAAYASPFGKAMHFGGSGNHIDLGSAVIPTPYNEDYTFEFWVYMPSLAGRQELISQYASSQAGRMILNVNSDNTIDFYQNGLSNSGYVSSSALIYSNNWYHIAVANLNGTRSLYVDGNLIGSISGTQDMYSGNTVIGMSPGLSYGFNGYIQDFRVTKGLARYTANFTPPTASLEG